MFCVVVLQNGMDVVEGETGSYSGTCVPCDVVGIEEVYIKVEDTVDIMEEVSIKVEDTIDIKEEVSIKVEEAIDIKDEIPEAISIPSMRTEHEVRLWGVCEVLAAHAFREFYCPEKEIAKIHLTISRLGVMFWVPYTF